MVSTKSSLYLILQLITAKHHGVSPACMGLTAGGSLLESLRYRVVALASNSGVLRTVQRAAQEALRNGWSYLLPTAEERSRALAQLLPSSNSESNYLYLPSLHFFV